MAQPTARIHDPKYFEQAVSDYSDVVPFLQKMHQDTKHIFFVGYTFRPGKRKKAQTNLQKEVQVGSSLPKDPCKSSAVWMNRDDVV